MEAKHNGWSAHYQKKKSTESLERLASRTLSPPPETVPRYSRYITRVDVGVTRETHIIFYFLTMYHCSMKYVHTKAVICKCYFEYSH